MPAFDTKTAYKRDLKNFLVQDDKGEYYMQGSLRRLYLQKKVVKPSTYRSELNSRS